jgi:hypothetical protein
MSFIRKIKTFSAHPLAIKLLFAEALITSAWVKLTLKFFPFKKVMKWLGTAQHESEKAESPETLVKRKQIKTALQLCNRYAFWPTECYTLSLTGKLLLKRRDISSTIYIGFNKAEDGKYQGHAWLRANDTYISGLKEARTFTIHSLFS